MQPDPPEHQLRDLRAQISDEGHRIDRYNAGTAAALGAAAFLILLCLGATYDYVRQRTGLWASLGISHQMLGVAAWTFGGAGAALTLYGLMRQRKRQSEGETELQALEDELADLLEEIASKE